jgi:hypothetical protein
MESHSAMRESFEIDLPPNQTFEKKQRFRKNKTKTYGNSGLNRSIKRLLVTDQVKNMNEMPLLSTGYFKQPCPKLNDYLLSS